MPQEGIRSRPVSRYSGSQKLFRANRVGVSKPYHVVRCWMEEAPTQPYPHVDMHPFEGSALSVSMRKPGGALFDLALSKNESGAR